MKINSSVNKPDLEKSVFYVTLMHLYLVGYIKEYLCLVPHDRKFLFRETADVLHQSATQKEDFSGYRAASAWNAIGMYAANLLAQPWRKEYKEMKVTANLQFYCFKGFNLLTR